MSSRVVYYFAAFAIIFAHSKIASVKGQCTTEGFANGGLSMSNIAENVEAFSQINKQIQNIHDVLIASFQQLTTQLNVAVKSLQAVDSRLEEHDVYIKQIQSTNKLVNESFQQTKSQSDSVNLSLQALDRRLQSYQIDIKNQTQQSWELVSGICDSIYPVRDCSDMKSSGHTANGVYEVCAGPPPSRVCSNAFCDMQTTNTASLVFQRRKNGSVNFNRTWAEYRDGFGNPDGEFWLGNEILHLLTSKRSYKLRVDLEDFNGAKRYAEYAKFSIYSSADNYRLTIGNYSGNAGDSMSFNNGRQFATIDADYGGRNCALGRGAWWHDGCTLVTLNGKYYQRYDTVAPAGGIHWHDWSTWNNWLKATEMKLLPL